MAEYAPASAPDAGKGAHLDLSVVIESADIRLLVVVLAQLTGDRRWFSEPFRPRRDGNLVAAPGAGLDPAAQAQVRAAALELLTSPPTESPRLGPADVLELMRLCTAETVPEDYVPYMIEELGVAPRDVRWSEPDAKRRSLHVVVVGAGVFGILAAIKLADLGIDYTLIERNDDVGGTWLVNRYPDCGVDTPNHLYSYSFAPNPDWPGYFVDRDSILGYLRHCVAERGMRSRIRFGTEVILARYNEADLKWDVVVRDGGCTETLRADAVISAVGQLNTPSIPDIPGLATFAGDCFHSAEWRDDALVDDARVGVIGAGASAIQLARPLARRARELTIFQRSPHWVMPQPAYRQAVSDATKTLLREMPHYHTWLRFWLFWKWGDNLLRFLHVDPQWPHPDRSLNSRHDAIRMAFTQYLTDQLDGRPDLRDKTLPDYPPFGKRMLIDNEWFATLRRPNVDLVTEPIEEVMPEGIVTADGALHQLDTLVLATGFRALDILGTLPVQGRGGFSLREAWGGNDARAYLGITMPGFPNFFCLYGPNTNLAHGGSAIFHAECQVRYVLQCLTWLAEHDGASIECRTDVHDEYNKRVDEQHAHMVWTHPRVRNWYTNRAGRVVSNTPWRLIDYWSMTRTPNISDFRIQWRG
jgi:4-hydroxyacetophenone monooxygenase